MTLGERKSEMMKVQLRQRGVMDPAVLAAMQTVPREAFVPRDMQEYAYQDSPLPIGEGQTISQPFIVARMIEHLHLGPEDRVLEIGTGSGYGAAVLSRIARTVYTVERHESLALAAQDKLAALGYRNVHVVVGDGSLGWPEQAPYEAILATAGAPGIPDPLKAQLAVGGTMVLPVGFTPKHQVLTVVRKKAEDHLEEEEMEPVRFVPLVGEAGWQ